MSKPRKFVYNTGSHLAKSRNDADSFSWSANNTDTVGTSAEYDHDFQLCLDLDDDDVDNLSMAELDRLEVEASKKLGIDAPSASSNHKKEGSFKVSSAPGVETMSRTVTAERTDTRPGENSRISMVHHQSEWTKSAPGSSQLQKLLAELEECKSEVRKLESNLFEKDGELKLLRTSLEKNRLENAEKSDRIIELRNKQNKEHSEREASLMKEVSVLKTRLSFQEQELKEQSNRIQSQTKPSGLSGGVKRKAEQGPLNGSFNLENSFIASQSSTGKKIPRISEKSPQKTSTKKDKATTTDKTGHAADASQLNQGFIYHSESRGLDLVKDLMFCQTTENPYDQDPSDFTSLLTLLKYPLRQLPEVLKSHSVSTCAEQPSQFPKWQSQKVPGSSAGENSFNGEVLDLESGKYNLVSQGIFTLLGLGSKAVLTSLQEHSVPPLGAMHILVFLELYVSSYLLTRETVNKNTEEDSLSFSPSVEEKQEQERTQIEDHEMIIQALQLLKLLFYSAPDLVGHVLERTNPSLFESDNDNDDVIIIDNSDEEPKNGEAAGSSIELTRIPRCSKYCLTQGSAELSKSLAAEGDAIGMGSFRSLLLANLEKLFVPHPHDEALTVCYGALDVLIAMTNACETTELERVFVLLKRGCLNGLLTRDSGSSTMLLVMALLKNLLPCEDVDKILCSHTDDCILLKIYQCACEEEDEEATTDVMSKNFLLQVLIFIKSVAFSHANSIAFLLETDCQCSQEVVRCLVLILQDKVNYLLDLNEEDVTSNDSLGILRTGMSLLVILCTHPSYSTDHKLDVEHYYAELIHKTMVLYKNIRHFIPEAEALGVQDLLDMEQMDEIEWSLGSDDEDNDSMEIDLF